MMRLYSCMIEISLDSGGLALSGADYYARARLAVANTGTCACSLRAATSSGVLLLDVDVIVRSAAGH